MDRKEKSKEWVVYINGDYLPESEAKISVFDHGVLHGDGVFDALFAWGGYVFKLDEHIDRFFRSIHACKYDMPLSKEELKNVVLKVVRTNREKNQYIKCLVTRGVGPLPLLTPIGCKTTVIVFSKPYEWKIDPNKIGSGIKARIVSIRRIPPQCLDPKVKNLNYLNFVLARREAFGSGADEAIMLDIYGFVGECPGSNLFIVKGKKLYTPPPEHILVGITRETIFEIAEREGLPVVEQQMTTSDLYNADEVLFTSTAGGITPVVDIDGRKISNGTVGPITMRMFKLYFRMLEEGYHGTPFL